MLKVLRGVSGLFNVCLSWPVLVAHTHKGVLCLKLISRHRFWGNNCYVLLRYVLSRFARINAIELIKNGVFVMPCLVFVGFVIKVEKTLAVTIKLCEPPFSRANFGVPA